MNPPKGININNRGCSPWKCEGVDEVGDDVGACSKVFDKIIVMLYLS
ncbi:hypothetical protein ACI6Q2_19260 [Chitinophagaceae bacterium LWZ2-11]